MLTPSLTGRLASQHETIAEMISGITQTRLNAHPIPDKWSIKDHIVHLATYQPMFLDRIRLILAEEHPEFAPYKADTDPAFIRAQNEDLPLLLINIAEGRRQLTGLCQILTNEQLGRKGTHLVYGNLTVAEWLEFFVLHEAHHLFAIFRLVHS
jgi:uncharacterized damage-inducible protein DinB